MRSVIVLLFVLSACGDEETVAPSEPVPLEAPPVAPDPEVPPSEGRIPADIEAAVTAGSDLPSTDAPHCAQALDAYRTMIEAYRRQLNLPPTTLAEPARRAFLAECEQLTEPQQRCLVLGYSAEHEEECREVSRTTDRAASERIDAAMVGLGLAARTREPAE